MLESWTDKDIVPYLVDELSFSMGLLKRFPKCYWIWSHRVWVLFKLESLGKPQWQNELMIVGKMLEYDLRNYHGWRYRRFVVENIEKVSVASASTEDEKTLALVRINEKEFEYTTSKINNISNFSAWHNRSQLIPKIYSLFHSLTDKSLFPNLQRILASPYTLLQHELDLVKTGMYVDADDSSVWLYLSWLITDKFFVDSFESEDEYFGLLQDQFAIIEELNELEKDDHPKGWDNRWCLKAMILIRTLSNRAPENDEFTKKSLERLIVIDPLRKNKYLDQLNSKLVIVSI